MKLTSAVNQIIRDRDEFRRLTDDRLTWMETNLGQFASDTYTTLVHGTCSDDLATYFYAQFKALDRAIDAIATVTDNARLAMDQATSDRRSAIRRAA
jgi:hypothetical protein